MTMGLFLRDARGNERRDAPLCLPPDRLAMFDAAKGFDCCAG